MSELLACPFCREIVEPAAGPGAPKCAACDLPLVPFESLPPAEPVDIPVPPEDREIARGHLGNSRGPVLALAVVGLCLFFVPWAEQRSPELRVMSGFAYARHAYWLWAAFVGWFVLFGVVVVQRSLRQLRGVRLVATFLVSLVLLSVLMRYYYAPKSPSMFTVRYVWLWGMHATAALAVLTMPFTLTLGRVWSRDKPTSAQRPAP